MTFITIAALTLIMAMVIDAGVTAEEFINVALFAIFMTYMVKPMFIREEKSEDDEEKKK